MSHCAHPAELAHGLSDQSASVSRPLPPALELMLARSVRTGAVAAGHIGAMELHFRPWLVWKMLGVNGVDDRQNCRVSLARKAAKSGRTILSRGLACDGGGLGVARGITRPRVGAPAARLFGARSTQSRSRRPRRTCFRSGPPFRGSQGRTTTGQAG